MAAMEIESPVISMAVAAWVSMVAPTTEFMAEPGCLNNYFRLLTFV
jgi:hypothetical protein